MGTIDYADINNFEALSNDGRLTVQVTNIGNVTAEFFVGVMNCTNDIMQVDVQIVSLQPLQSKQITFNIYTTSAQAQLHQCAVYLENSLGDLIETKNIYFNTSQQSINSNQDPNNQQTKPNEQIVAANTSSNAPTCDQMCPSLFDVFCFIVNVHKLIFSI